MKTYIQINDDGNVVGNPEVRDISSWDDVAKNRSGYVLREYIDNPPQYSSSIQRLQKVGYSITDTTVTVNYITSSLSSSEIAQNSYNTAIQNGYDTGMGFKLKLLDSDRAAFTSFTTLLNLALQYKVISTSSLFPIKDASDSVVYMSASQYYPMAIAYGLYYSNLWSSKVSASVS